MATDSLVAGGKTHLLFEHQDAYGRSSGYTYAKSGSTQQSVSYAYGDDGRIASAGFLFGNADKLFTYGYLVGTNLLHTLTMPNGMSLTQEFETQRDLLTAMLYKRGTTGVSEHHYTYESLGRPQTLPQNQVKAPALFTQLVHHQTQAQSIPRPTHAPAKGPSKPKIAPKFALPSTSRTPKDSVDSGLQNL